MQLYIFTEYTKWREINFVYNYSFAEHYHVHAFRMYLSCTHCSSVILTIKTLWYAVSWNSSWDRETTLGCLCRKTAYLPLYLVTNCVIWTLSSVWLQTCTVISDTEMSCPTPYIKLPGQFINLTLGVPTQEEEQGTAVPARARRDTDDDEGQTIISEHEVSDER